MIETTEGHLEDFAGELSELARLIGLDGLSVNVRARAEHRSVERMAQDVAVHVLRNIDAYAEGAIIAAAARFLRGRPRRGRSPSDPETVRVCGSDGQLLREIRRDGNR